MERNRIRHLIVRIALASWFLGGCGDEMRSPDRIGQSSVAVSNCGPNYNALDDMGATTGSPAGPAWNLWSNGHLNFRHRFRSEIRVVVKARGSSAGGVWPRMRVTVGGTDLGTKTVSRSFFREYYYVMPARSRNEEVRIYFTNDAIIGDEDRNLIIEQVRFRCFADSPAPGPSGDLKIDNALVYADFDRTGNGQISAQAMKDAFMVHGPITGPNVATESGFYIWHGSRIAHKNRVSTIDGSSAYGGSGRSIRIRYPRNQFGPGENGTGAQFRVEVPGHRTDLYAAYRVRFSNNFDWGLGGKLPGFEGGESNSGCAPTWNRGWSARSMWRPSGRAVSYLYTTQRNPSNNCGIDHPWNLGGQRYFSRGRWHTVETRVRLNTPGSDNGVVEGWIDGVRVANYRDIPFRPSTSPGSSTRIESLYFSTFHGGNSSIWAPNVDCYADFDDVVISTSPITH